MDCKGKTSYLNTNKFFEVIEGFWARSDKLASKTASTSSLRQAQRTQLSPFASKIRARTFVLCTLRKFQR